MSGARAVISGDALNILLTDMAEPLAAISSAMPNRAAAERQKTTRLAPLPLAHCASMASWTTAMRNAPHAGHHHHWVRFPTAPSPVSRE